MVAINFKPEFAEPVESGVKRQTIRQTARCRRGDKTELAFEVAAFLSRDPKTR